ncbi:MAG TPA: YibE/F family protein [Candidatus Paceibacterota bacterium]|nr:YibE/F family protein [Candidatus Paceibacterota bacterium]
MHIRVALLGLALLLTPFLAAAQMLVPDTEILAKAQVLSVSGERTEEVLGTGTVRPVQTLTVEVLDGPEKGETVTFVNDFTQLKEGDVFYLRHITSPSEGTEFYSMADPYRLPVLAALFAVFLALLLLFGGLQGLRGLAALAGSLALIFYLLLPGIASGFSPVLVAVGVSSLIIVMGSYVTHGFNRTTTSAVFGMIATVVLTGLAAWYAVDAALLSGFHSDEATQLYFQFDGSLDLVGILMSGILIGLLGVLYDAAIGQAVSVEELMRAGKHLTRRQVYARAIRIGREHIGALVNTLAIAYVGAALPLFLLLEHSTAPWGYILNGEVFATEIVRILIGSMGLILAVPITTLIAVFFIRSEGAVARNAVPHRHNHQ